MAKWAVTFNGFGSEGASQHTWSHVNIKSQSADPVFSDDGISIETTKHTITGTALISETTESNFRTALLNAREHLTSQPKQGETTSVRVWLDFDSSGTNEMTGGINSSNDVAGIDTQINTSTSQGRSVVYYGTMEDDYGTPTCSYSINEMYGTLTALVSFTITWHKIEPPAEDVTYHVLSHTWTQEYTIDNVGATTLVVDGQLRVRNFIDGKMNPGSFSNSGSRGANPDRYRTLVMPVVPPNFRVESMRWATDSTGCKLLYRITLKEYSRPLPYPAKAGSGRFTYQRGLGNMMGTKTFEGELEGDVNSDPRELLNSLIRIAASRISFGGAVGDTEITTDLIQSITVSENDVFSKRSISLRIVAMGMQTTSQFGLENETGSGFGLLKPFFEQDDLSVAPRPNEYGAQLISSVKRQMFFPWNPDDSEAWSPSEFPVATWKRGDEWAGEDVSLEFDDVKFEEAAEPPVQETGEHTQSSIEATGHIDKPYGLVSGSESITVKNNIVVVPSMHANASDLVYQTGSPEVYMESEYQVSRIGKPPRRISMSKPNNGITLEESFIVSRGDVDANNNRTYIGIYRRVVRLLDNADSSGFYTTNVTIPGWGEQTFTAWWPPYKAISSPADPRFEGNENQPGSITRNLLQFNEGDSQGVGQMFKLGNPEEIYGN
ncbi:MAG: hypothetical protein Tp1124DCM412911_16 [Prokaryotic dsDNA virus sp.]|nr:MAG: hypothetical protein Tp1124DCM412911_16 [Prokaryotic dsDNA virus sp.]|tara:strand:+ start:22228 stop:24216 length:1989 start_codon:yes stop_codon:yes gene_type:complete